MKAVVGIICNLKTVENHPYDSVYKTVSSYIKRLEEINTIPIGLYNIENNLEVLNMCDAFIFPGGIKVTRDHYYIIDHCIKMNKPLLGICLGMQAMVLYDHLYDEKKTIQEIYESYKEYKKKDIVLHNLENEVLHGATLVEENSNASLDKIKESIHPILIKKDSLLYSIVQREKMNVTSMHKRGCYETKHLFKVTSYSEDQIIESVEYNGDNHFILGIQFHIELEENNRIFKRFKEEIEKRKNVNEF